MGDHPEIMSAKLDAARYGANFADVKPPLGDAAALVEAERCYFCYDAPCVEACPTGIDIPSFIRKIATGNLRGSALDILSANIFGGMCARVCPTEVLCEQVCVRVAQEGKPVQIGRLQRHATDALLANSGANGAHPFTRRPPTGKRIAIVGAGPAGLACAHRAAMLGHDVVVFEARPKAGGLNEYGIAAYKTPDGFAQRELAFILEIGGIALRAGEALGNDIRLADLRREYDAVFLGMGLAGMRALTLDGATLKGVEPAVDYIARLRQADDLSTLPVGRRIIVIGGGNTAIDIAVQTKRLGAEDVTIVYRRGPEQMSATGHEQAFAQTNGVRIRHWAEPRRFLGKDGHVAEVEFGYTRLDGEGRLAATGETYRLAADQVFTAVGQILVRDPLTAGAAQTLALEDGKIKVDAQRRTSLEGVYAGGDCAATGEDFTVQAVEDGKIAAHAIDRALHAA